MKKNILICALLLLLNCRNRDLNVKYITEEKILMDTIISVKIPDSQNAVGIFNSVFAEFERIEKKFGKSAETSIIYKINNRDTDTRIFYIDDEEKKIFEYSKYYYEFTDGYFDITMFTLGQFWNFDMSEDTDVPAILQNMESVYKYCGSDNFTVTDSSIILKNNFLKMDLGGIAKGYAIDMAGELLRKNNIQSAIINAGGDVLTIGAKNFRNEWNVAVQHPEKPDEYLKILKMKNSAVATSGNYQRFVTFDNKRYNHIFNPKTGKNTEYFKSVSVEAATAMQADALATAIFASEDNYKFLNDKIKKKFTDVKIHLN